ncbi:alpha/beta-hydrolase family protein [Nitratireductor aquimarinus]|uniref:alpha/beta hydrolase n=1 Tax=Nitratireductor TaxID=245876 RepID=UPI0019D4036A|nr:MULTISPECIES: alpha/beta-hydrolase family protein [Nitratireductor]MBN7776526.1 alpha/beta-hydrolase family protein [Nitratireductor pacificus]MBN7779393.1 alpha/beta-hydrolase family protein [Nitratireductor pacificus]MBN7788200.1 alpha/beta-hydrolase family protein [Nitratireductor aquimarinus]MBY6098247.1 alpha/beta-hydrolase family protein [Nitratireductor aquimarinus]MCA1259225.1 alpha/beta-hydrolase family protein [Nitratireductor aquimarinus]
MGRLYSAFQRHFSGAGMVLGVLFFFASLTPSLIPRSFEVQGILGGVAFSAGYGIGVLLVATWRYLQLPSVDKGLLRLTRLVLSLISLIVIVVGLYNSAAWQNSVRGVLNMEPVDSAYPVSVIIIAILTFAFLFLLARGIIALGRAVANRLDKFLPRRVSIIAGAAVTLIVVATLANGLLIEYTFRLLDKSFAELDALHEPERPQPSIVERAGNPSSRLEWPKLGRAGREFVASGPTAADISQVTQRAAVEPIRLYAGLQVAETPDERSQLLLDELIELNAFDRAALVVVTPTGTGWVDPSAIDGLEYLYDGDTASVALQYSYLNSPLSLVFQSENGLESSQSLFRTIYRYWQKLPVDQRPKLFLHGLSLGAFNSQRSITFLDLLGDPIDGAVWSGTPFPSEKWQTITADRDAGSTQWLPVYQGGRFVRFMNQNGVPEGNTAPWGNVRIVYLQYASDAITFFDKHLLYREADWMKAPRGPDVSPLLSWYPIVSMLQLLVDMPLSDGVPMGYGHVYAPDHYLDAWLEVTGVENWSSEEIDALKMHLHSKASNADGYEYRGG